MNSLITRSSSSRLTLMGFLFASSANLSLSVLVGRLMPKSALIISTHLILIFERYGWVSSIVSLTVLDTGSESHTRVNEDLYLVDDRVQRWIDAQLDFFFESFDGL